MGAIAHFIYVFSDQSKEQMLSLGYELIKADRANDIYVFAFSDHMDFADADISYILSDTLSF